MTSSRTVILGVSQKKVACDLYAIKYISIHYIYTLYIYLQYIYIQYMYVYIYICIYIYVYIYILYIYIYICIYIIYMYILYIYCVTINNHTHLRGLPVTGAILQVTTPSSFTWVIMGAVPKALAQNRMIGSNSWC